MNCYKIDSLLKFKAVSKRLSQRNRWVDLFKQVSPDELINHTARYKSRRSHMKAVSVQIHKKKSCK